MRAKKPYCRRTSVHCVYVLLPALLAGAFIDPATTCAEDLESKQRLEQGLLVVLPPAEGSEEAKLMLVQGLSDSGLPYAIRVHPWGFLIPGLGPCAQRTTESGNRKAAKRLAKDILEYQQNHPDRPIFIVGHSGGAGLAVFALEALAATDGAKPVDGAFLFVAGIAADHDLTKALSATRRGIVNVYDTKATERASDSEGGIERVDSGKGPLAGQKGFTTSYPHLFDMEAQAGFTKRVEGVAVINPERLAKVAPVWALSATWPPEGEDAAAQEKDVRLESDEPTADSNLDLVKKNPQEFLRKCFKQCAEKYPSYRCLFTKNDRLRNKLTGNQVMETRYRYEPRSVYMEWKKNSLGAKRVLWIQGQNLSKKGEERLRIEPTGFAAAFTKDVSLPLTDKRVADETRRPITGFGYYSTLEGIIKANDQAAKDGVLDFKFEGKGTVDGRPSYKLVRNLPYDPKKKNQKYSSARMILHMDQERLVPLSIHYFADRNERTLLEYYLITDLRLKPPMTDKDFKW